MSGDLTVIVFAMGEDRYALPVAMVREIRSIGPASACRARRTG